MMRTCLLALAVSFTFLHAAAQPTSGLSREVSFPSDGITVPGTLTMPAGKPPAAGWPLIVLVQGSGPSDRDETIGPNKVFRDLAEQLATHGVATLRYDKRTYRMKTGEIKLAPGDVAKLTLAIEVVDDAVAALACASTLDGIDHKRIFVAGHSLGGLLAPRIATERLKAAPGSVRGIIELAAEAVPVNALLPFQVGFQTLLRGQGIDQTEAAVGNMQAMLADAIDPKTDPGKMEGGVPARYWREWASTDPAGTLKAMALPALVLHGQKDVQVLYVDYVLLARAATAPGSKAQEFPNLNHLFMPVAGESSGDEYAEAGHVAPVVAETIAAWLPQ